MLHNLTIIGISFRCPVDDTVKMVNSSSKQSQRFSVEAWKFVGEFAFVYLHCSVVVCKAGDLDSRCSKGCIPGLHVNPPYAVMEKLKKQSQGRVKRELVENKDPEYLISKGPFSLNEATVDDGSEISLKGPQQDQSKMEVKEGTGENKGEIFLDTNNSIDVWVLIKKKCYKQPVNSHH